MPITTAVGKDKDMGLFDKMFGKKADEEKTTAAAQAKPGGSIDFVDALLLQVRGEVDPALNLYLDIAAKAPTDTLAPFFAAAILAGQGRVAEAVETLRALSRHFASAGENISRGLTVQLAELLQDKPLPKLPAVADIVVSFGDLLKSERMLQESAVCFEMASALVPDNAHVLHKFGDTLHDLRMYDYAESVLKEALQCAPHHWGALYTYAVLLQDLGRNEEAISHYERAVKLVPTHATCQNNYGAALLRVDRVEDALTHCTLAEQLDPKAPLVKINLGFIHSVRQEFEKARSCFTEAIALNDKLSPAYFGLASVEQSLQADPKRVQDLYLKAIELTPTLAEAHYALGRLLAAQNDTQALSYFSSAALLNNDISGLHKDFGLACLQFGRREEALQQLRLALQQNPDDAAVQQAIADAEESPA